jgi:prolyl-tRNA editing enzyme YbaK/EbsC (Cys-tRNA(Pro) deacylase)
LCVLPQSEQVSLSAVASRLALGPLVLCPERGLVRLFGHRKGTSGPFGLRHVRGCDTLLIVDSSLRQQARLALGAGTEGVNVSVCVGDLVASVGQAATSCLASCTWACITE